MWQSLSATVTDGVDGFDTVDAVTSLRCADTAVSVHVLLPFRKLRFNLGVGVEGGTTLLAS